MSDPTLPLEGLSSVNGKAVIARFDGGSYLPTSCPDNDILRIVLGRIPRLVT